MSLNFSTKIINTYIICKKALNFTFGVDLQVCKREGKQSTFYRQHALNNYDNPLKKIIMSPFAITMVCIGGLLIVLFVAYFCMKRNTRRK